MAIKPGDLLALADDLVKQKTEVAYRSAISRSYYAAYHAAFEYAEKNKIEDSEAHLGKGDHRRLIDRFKKMGNGESRVIANMLEGARVLRAQADYDLDITLRDVHVQMQLKTVNKLMDKILTPVSPV